MNTFQLECFLAVASYLNFARAAEQMNVTQPSITRQVKSLESELKIKLFHRTTRSVELTIEGRIFLDDARNIVALSKRAADRFGHLSDQPSLDFSIGCQGFAGLQMLPAVLQTLSIKYPNLHPYIKNSFGFSLLDFVEEGRLDVAVGFQDSGKKNSSLHFRELKKTFLTCIVKADHPLAKRKSAHIDDLANHPLILFDPAHMMGNMAQLQWRLTNTHSPSEMYLCESPEAALLMVEAGFGLSILLDIVYPFEGMHLITIPLEGVEPFSWGIYYKDVRPNPIVKEFIHLMEEIGG